MYYIFVFKSRTSSINFYEMLRKQRIPANIISTPSAANVSCGLSVKIMPENLDEAYREFDAYNFSTFLGVFRVTHSNYHTSVERIR